MRAILLLSSPDKTGLVSEISRFIFERKGNILDLDEHVDVEEKLFFIRVEWELTDGDMSFEKLSADFGEIGKQLNADWKIHLADRKLRVAIFVSKYDHCLQEILWRHRLNEFSMEIPLIISNHPDLEYLAQQNDIPYYYIPKEKSIKAEQEAQELDLLARHNIDTIVLARYMQILSDQFVARYPNNIINIHHSFLPAFIGANPYKQAYQRGVKIIGATSHYVTADLDEGPIIEQDIIRISHRDSLKDLIRKGRDLERIVLSKALYYHCGHRILVQKGKTIVFE